jgi:hypothetical protein
MRNRLARRYGGRVDVEERELLMGSRIARLGPSSAVATEFGV